MVDQTQTPTIPTVDSKADGKNDMFFANLAKSPGPYIPGTSWSYWKRMFLNYLSIRQVTDNRIKVLVLLTELGQVANTALEGLLHGATPEGKPFDDLLSILEKHYTPKVLVLAERYKLLQLSQKDNQSLSEFYAELSQAARDCRFTSVTDFEDCMVRMAFVKGIKNKNTRLRLLEKEEDGDSTGLLTLAQAFEAAQNQATSLNPSGAPLANVIGKVERNQPPRNQNQNRPRPVSSSTSSSTANDNDDQLGMKI
ncbi:hypothetical protein PRIPAC_81348 [Pristionchus pacificus]|uniref:Uncharacterized protein n=1 Tax=Pristionchus pacificus TaxID=54126 RepID=A0A2A6CMQ2_PRIPA|nr:hypothetical protein PRIPAC_81348 [Pristionchus pacificus]|eukprot:PDM79389.1 hypothetical protein PRIPAC_31968 [Pristionchus pacificus]